MKADGNTFFVIWTTTPWTLPANQAIAVHPKFTYRLVKTAQGDLIINQELIDQRDASHRSGSQGL